MPYPAWDYNRGAHWIRAGYVAANNDADALRGK